MIVGDRSWKKRDLARTQRRGSSGVLGEGGASRWSVLGDWSLRGGPIAAAIDYTCLFMWRAR